MWLAAVTLGGCSHGCPNSPQPNHMPVAPGSLLDDAAASFGDPDCRAFPPGGGAPDPLSGPPVPSPVPLRPFAQWHHNSGHFILGPKHGTGRLHHSRDKRGTRRRPAEQGSPAPPCFSQRPGPASEGPLFLWPGRATSCPRRKPTSSGGGEAPTLRPPVAAGLPRQAASVRGQDPIRLRPPGLVAVPRLLGYRELAYPCLKPPKPATTTRLVAASSTD